ncbi:hypothetical protein N7520_003678 [Penicillium odoratum]|uniref:uncharacterized protein n=1 Tax=Penicillium odoratum TaxID=1167516 RepID=UPI00254862B3|nr:uncharacterized protein N7520_003678 [Penicillium odoratum]KAJ5769119.1 hypothetical protein N7520_003678 [Penicillium odoratum]
MQSMSTEESVLEPSRSYIPRISPTLRPNMSLATQSIMTMPPTGLPSYHALFLPGSEIPRFAISYRWWEDEATTVLWAFNIPDLCLLIRYALFRDENLPRNALISRNAETVDLFLLALSDAREHPSFYVLSNVQRVEEVLRRSRIPPLRPIHWSWFPPRGGLDPRSIASAIEKESHCQFLRVDFEEIVRAALGYPSPSVEWFLQQHTALYIHLVDHLRVYPDEILAYVEAEKYLRDRSPFAHRAVVKCLHTVLPTFNVHLPTSPGLEFVASPVQSLFKNPQYKLTTILKILSVLAKRFRTHYSQMSTMDWVTPFDTTAVFLEECLSTTSSKDLAQKLFEIDEMEFSQLSRQSIITCDIRTTQLVENWHTISMSTWECCCALPDMIKTLQECAQASLPKRLKLGLELQPGLETNRKPWKQTLYTKKDYYSSTAILEGLHRFYASTAQLNVNGSYSTVVVDTCVSPEAASLITSAQNYAVYRQHYVQNPGIPFLFPHIRDYQQHGESSIQPLLDFLQDFSKVL